MSPNEAEERERQTRKRRIDPKLRARGWSVVSAEVPRTLFPEAVSEYEKETPSTGTHLGEGGRASAFGSSDVRKKAAGRLCELRRSPFGGACDFSCCVKPQARVGYT